jgi:multicomponent Na+:H+ antiporter subunit G
MSDSAWELLGGIFLVIGATFILLAGIGVVRFPDIYSRMHAAAKAPALGIMCIGIGVALSVRTTTVIISVILVVVLQLIAGPVGAHVLARSVYYGMRPPMDAVDELAAADEEAPITDPDPQPDDADDP